MTGVTFMFILYMLLAAIHKELIWQGPSLYCRLQDVDVDLPGNDLVYITGDEAMKAARIMRSHDHSRAESTHLTPRL